MNQAVDQAAQRGLLRLRVLQLQRSIQCCVIDSCDLEELVARAMATLNRDA
jgi:hypothetical protein